MSLTICLFLFCQGTYFSIFCCSYICKWWVGNYSKGTVFMPFLVKDCPVVVEIVFMNQNSYRKSFFLQQSRLRKHFKDFVDWQWSSTLMTTSANVVQTSVTNTANNQSLNYALPNDQDIGSKFCSVKEKKPDSIGTLNSTKRIVPDNIIFNQHFSLVFLRA